MSLNLKYRHTNAHERLYISTAASTVALSPTELNLRDSLSQRTKRRDKRLIIYRSP